MKPFIRCSLISLLGLLPLAAQSHEPGAHVHGLATLQIAVDEHTLTLDFSSPLDNLLGFEHMPRNEQEKAAVQSMINALNKANLLFVPTAAAQCVLKTVNLDSPVIAKKSQPSSPEAKSHDHEEAAGHADLDGEFVFNCGQSGKLHDMQVNLFQQFPHMHQVKVEIISAHGQTATTLTPEKHSFSW